MRIDAVSTVTPTFPNTVLDMPNISTDASTAVAAPERTFKESIGQAAYEEAGIDPADVSLAEVYDLSTALELDWMRGPPALRRAARPRRCCAQGDTTLGGRIPVNPSGGLACFGEAVPAQALAQVCEVTWQLRGQAGRPPGRGRHRRHHRQPGPVRPRLLGDPQPLISTVSAQPRH